MHAINLDSGELIWQRTLGNTRRLAPFGISFEWGIPTLGGPIVTATGLIFIAATMDGYIRALDAANGTELWRGDLPANGNATPMTYTWKGHQYIVIAAGGHPDSGQEIANYLVAFALPIEK